MSSSRWLAVVSVEEQRGEEQLRRLIGDAAYTVWEQTGRIHIGQWSIRRNLYGGIALINGASPQCVGPAWGFKGAIPKADQVIALCLWLHADEEAVISRAFPRVASMPRTQRAKHWDAIVSGQEPMELPARTLQTPRCMDKTTISRLVQEYEGRIHTAKEWNRLLSLSPTTCIWDTTFAKDHLIRVDHGPPALSKCVPKKDRLRW